MHREVLVTHTCPSRSQGLGRMTSCHSSPGHWGLRRGLAELPEPRLFCDRVWGRLLISGTFFQVFKTAGWLLH